MNNLKQILIYNENSNTSMNKAKGLQIKDTKPKLYYTTKHSHSNDPN